MSEVKPTIKTRDITRAYLYYVIEGHYNMMSPKRMVAIFKTMADYYEGKKSFSRVKKIESLIDKINGIETKK